MQRAFMKSATYKNDIMKRKAFSRRSDLRELKGLFLGEKN